MTDTDLLPALTGSYTPDVTPLRGRSKRADWYVQAPPPVSAVEAPDFVAAMRRFFSEMDAEITARSDDPIALAQGLARIEALLADVRYVRDRLRDTAATGLQAAGIRKLTVEGVLTCEQVNDSPPRDWDDAALVRRLVEDAWPNLVDADTGERVTGEQIADRVLACASVSYWRMGALRERCINPDDYSEQATDEDGSPIKRPSIRMHDNRVRGRQ